jgi:glycosyltransferase involved in cell wall biosynthesis
MSEMISVIVPVYNTADYLNTCFSSVACQEEVDFEVIIIDDGSTDDSPGICDEWQKKDRRFRVIHQKNSGQAAARNHGIDAATGDYVAFVDSDDYISSDYLKEQLGALKKNNADIVLCGYMEHKPNGERTLGPIEDEVLDRNSALEKLIRDDTFKSLCCARMFKKTLFDGIRFPEGRNYEDLATNYRLFDKADRVCAISKTLYHYQIREGSMSYNDHSAAGWHNKCHSNVASQIERTDFFRKKMDNNLAERSLAESIPYIYSDIMTGHQVGNKDDVMECRRYLRSNRKQILDNRFVSKKDKTLYYVYSSNDLVFKLFKHIKK